MSTLLAVYTRDGCIGRCDAKCYDAKHPGCECICGGANHGAGLKQATDNTREMFDTWLETYAKERRLESWWSEVPALEPVQLELPLEDL